MRWLNSWQIYPICLDAGIKLIKVRWHSNQCQRIYFLIFDPLQHINKHLFHFLKVERRWGISRPVEANNIIFSHSPYFPSRWPRHSLRRGLVVFETLSGEIFRFVSGCLFKVPTKRLDAVTQLCSSGPGKPIILQLNQALDAVFQVLDRGADIGQDR